MVQSAEELSTEMMPMTKNSKPAISAWIQSPRREVNQPKNSQKIQLRKYGNVWHWNTYMNELWFLQVNDEMQNVMSW